MENNVQKKYPAIWAKEYPRFIQAKSYNMYVEAKNKKIPLVFGKQKIDGIDFVNIFKSLGDIKQETKLILPDLLAYEYTKISYGFKNREFNNHVAVDFSNALVGENICEGYIWMSKRDDSKYSTMLTAYQLSKMGLTVCKGKELHELKKIYYRSKYLYEYHKKKKAGK